MADANFEVDSAYQSIAPGQGLSVDVAEDVALDLAKTLGEGADDYLKAYVNYRREQAGIPAMQSYDVKRVFNSPAMRALAQQEMSMSSSDVSGAEIRPPQAQAQDTPSVRSAPIQDVGVEFRSGVGVPRRPEKLEMEEAFAEATEQLGVGGLSEAAQEAERAAAKEKKLFEDLGQELKEFKIQPFRAYDNTMFAVVAAISAGLGAAAQSLTGVPNTAVKLINQAIDRDIQSQKDQYNALKDKTNVQNNVYGRAMNALGDAKKAEDVAKRLAYQTAIQRVDASEKRYSQNEQLRTTAQRYRDMFALESAKLGAMTARSRQDKQERSLSRAAAGLDQIETLIKGFDKIGTLDAALTQVGEFFGGITGRTALGSEEANKVFEDRLALRKNFPALIPTILRAAGEVGALSEQEQAGIREALNAALPGVSLSTIFAREEQSRQFKTNLKTLRAFLGVVGQAGSGAISKEAAREKLLSLAEDLQVLEG